MKQLTMFKDLENKAVKLDKESADIESYLVFFHFGTHKAIPMKKLAGIFNINDRALRRVISNIRMNGEFYIVGSIKGYYAVKRDDFIDNKMKTRTVNSIRRLVKSNPELIGIMYQELNDIKKELTLDA